jgi:hypothetical protein
MNSGAVLAIAVFAATGALCYVGTVDPVPTAVYFAGNSRDNSGLSQDNLLRAPSTAEDAVHDLGIRIRQKEWQDAYESLANKADFSESEFQHDLTGYTLDLRTYADLTTVDVRPLRESADDAQVEMRMHLSTVVGPVETTRQLHVVRNGDRWQVEWPLMKNPQLPPQVIANNYLRWDIIWPGPGDDWGEQSVQGPNVRIVDMHPLNRADGVYVMGELMDDDTVPAYVNVRATLVGSSGAALGEESAFDQIVHTLLPKQVTPFLIRFPGVDLAQVRTIQMHPLGALVPASADPVVEVQNQKFVAAPVPELTGQVCDQSGQTINIAHVLSIFYDKNGQVVWVASQYIDHAMLPQTPADFSIQVPEDIAKQVSSERTVVATWVAKGNA